MHVLQRTFIIFSSMRIFKKYKAKKNSKNNKMKKPDPDAETCPNTATLIHTLNTNLETQLCLEFLPT